MNSYFDQKRKKKLPQTLKFSFNVCLGIEPFHLRIGSMPAGDVKVAILLRCKNGAHYRNCPGFGTRDVPFKIAQKAGFTFSFPLLFRGSSNRTLFSISLSKLDENYLMTRKFLRKGRFHYWISHVMPNFSVFAGRML